MNILEALEHPDLFGPHFQPAESWSAWTAFLAALFGLPMTPAQAKVFRQCTGRKKPRKGGFSEAWVCAGRRSGKSRILALCAVWLAMQPNLEKHLSAGERASILILAADRKQARTILEYVRGFLSEIPTLQAHYLETESKETIELSNRVMIEITTASHRGVRGYSCLAVCADEVSFWRSDEFSASPDREVMMAVRPALASIPHSKLLVASSPHARRGELYRAAQRYEGKEDGRALFWRSPTRVMNPSIPQFIIDEATEDDPELAASEWLAEFRNDLESYIARDVVQACVAPGINEIGPDDRISYHAAVDTSGGSGKDSMTMAIAHMVGDKVIIDAVREAVPSFDPYAVTEEFCDLLFSYRCKRVTGDRFGGDWPARAFAKCGVQYVPAEKTKSDYYLDAIPLFMRGSIQLLDSDRLVGQIAALERRRGRGGRHSVDHPPQGHDDIANVVCIAAFPAVKKRHRTRIISNWFSDPVVEFDSNDSPEQAERRRRAEAAVENPGKMASVWLGRPNPNIQY